MSQINLTIDSEDKLAARASLAFFQTLLGDEPVIIKAPAKIPVLKPEDKTAPAGIEQTEPGKAPERPEPEETISLNDLRLIVAKKAKTHKAAIRDWLNEKGYTKTPEVPQELYGEYVEFLNTLA